MATPSNLVGLGMPWPLAETIGLTIREITIAGATAGAATQVGGPEGIYYVLASNSGSGIKLPPITGGQNGALQGDLYMFVNAFSSAILIYAANNSKGSVVTLIGNGGAITGTTGCSLLNNHCAFFRALNISTWAFVKTSV